jgi:hypothetical protein
MMLEMAEAQGRNFRRICEPMVKVKQVGLYVHTHLGSQSSKVVARGLVTAYVIDLGYQCCRRQT